MDNSNQQPTHTINHHTHVYDPELTIVHHPHPNVSSDNVNDQQPVSGASAPRFNPDGTPVKRRPGRPKGSTKKNLLAGDILPPKIKRPVGRPRKDGLPAGSVGPGRLKRETMVVVSRLCCSDPTGRLKLCLPYVRHPTRALQWQPFRMGFLSVRWRCRRLVSSRWTRLSNNLEQTIGQT